MMLFDGKWQHGNDLGFDIKMPYGVATQQKIGGIKLFYYDAAL
jgi:hypothetical protein